jgi:hypothetical protein
MQSHGQKRTPEGMLTSLLLAVAAMNATPSPHPHTAVRWLVGCSGRIQLFMVLILSLEIVC